MTNTHAPTGAFKAFALALVCALSGPSRAVSIEATTAAALRSLRARPVSTTPRTLWISPSAWSASQTPILTGTRPSFRSRRPRCRPASSFDAATGTISGTPTAITPAATYTINASNGFGSDYVGFRSPSSTSRRRSRTRVRPRVSYHVTTRSPHHADVGRRRDGELRSGPSLPSGPYAFSASACSRARRPAAIVRPIHDHGDELRGQRLLRAQPHGHRQPARDLVRRWHANLTERRGDHAALADEHRRRGRELHRLPGASRGTLAQRVAARSAVRRPRLPRRRTIPSRRRTRAGTAEATVNILVQDVAPHITYAGARSPSR